MFEELFTMPPIIYVLLAGVLMLLVISRILKTSPKKLESAEETEKSVYRAVFGSWTCEHGPFGTPRVITVKDKPVGVSASMFCPECTKQYFEKFSTLCDKCGDVIAPGMPVGQHYELVDGEQKLLTVCQKWDCCIGGDLCGIWGEGKINEALWGNPEVRRAPAIIPVTVQEAVVESVTEVASLQSPEKNPPPVQEA